MCLKYIMRLIVYSGVDSGPVEEKKQKKHQSGLITRSHRCG